ncbi:hypothetical protein L218DRAFT_1004237 [Marasmius fiardii PR-910]|nr:hypothetical protein L218DRAFT_1004237 [Marasmius fiardii PR-910]
MPGPSFFKNASNAAIRDISISNVLRDQFNNNDNANHYTIHDHHHSYTTNNYTTNHTTHTLIYYGSMGVSEQARDDHGGDEKPQSPVGLRPRVARQSDSAISNPTTVNLTSATVNNLLSLSQIQRTAMDAFSCFQLTNFDQEQRQHTPIFPFDISQQAPIQGLTNCHRNRSYNSIAHTPQSTGPFLNSSPFSLHDVILQPFTIASTSAT